MCCNLGNYCILLTNYVSYLPWQDSSELGRVALGCVEWLWSGWHFSGSPFCSGVQSTLSALLWKIPPARSGGLPLKGDDYWASSSMAVPCRNQLFILSHNVLPPLKWCSTEPYVVHALWIPSPTPNGNFVQQCFECGNMIKICNGMHNSFHDCHVCIATFVPTYVGTIL